MNKHLSITIISILGHPPRSVLLQNNMSSFGLKSSQFILFQISTNLSPNSLIHSHSWRIAKSVRFLMITCIVYIIFIDYNLIRFFGILSSKRSPVEQYFAFTKKICKAGHVTVTTIGKF